MFSISWLRNSCCQLVFCWKKVLYITVEQSKVSRMVWTYSISTHSKNSNKLQKTIRFLQTLKMMRKFIKHFNSKWYKNSKRKWQISNTKISLLRYKTLPMKTYLNWINWWWNSSNFWWVIYQIWNYLWMPNNRLIYRSFIFTTQLKLKRHFHLSLISRFSNGRPSKKITTNKMPNRS